MPRSMYAPNTPTPAERRRATLRRAVLGLLLVVAAIQLFYLGIGIHNDTILSAAVAQEVAPSDAASVKMRKLLAYLERVRPSKQLSNYYSRDQSWFARSMRLVGPSSLTSLLAGGDCAQTSRAYINLLHAAGVRSAKRAVINHKGVAAHAVVEVETESGPVFVDPSFNLVLESDDGQAYTREELIAHPEWIASVVSRAAAQGNHRVAYYEHDTYAYAALQAVNWDRDPISRMLRAVLGLFVNGQSLDQLRRPILFEKPSYFMATLAAVAEVGFLGLWFVLRPRGGAGTLRAGNGSLADVKAPGAALA